MCATPWRIWTPFGSFPKLKLTPQKLLSSMNSISKFPAALMVEVMRKLLLVVNGPVRSGVSGQSVRSIDGLADWMLVNSDCSSVKIVFTSVSSAGPAGTQNSEHEVPRVMSQLAISARAVGTVGRWKLLDIGPARLAREKATAKTISSLTIGIVLKFFPERGSGILALKDYPRAGFRVNLEQD